MLATLRDNSYLATIAVRHPPRRRHSTQASIFGAVAQPERYELRVSEPQNTFDETPSLGDVTVGQAGGQPGTTNNIVVTVTAADDRALRTASTQVQSSLEAVPGLTDVSSDLSDLRPVLKVEVDLTKAARLGFTSSEVGQAIADASRGTNVGTVVLSGERGRFSCDRIPNRRRQAGRDRRSGAPWQPVAAAAGRGQGTTT